MTTRFSSRAYLAGLFLAMAAAFPMAAHAVDGTITINGEITDQTCQINGAAPPYNLVVNLPKIATGALPAGVGSRAGGTIFTIALSNCPEALEGDVRAHFEPGVTSNDHAKGWLFAYSSNAASAVQAAIPSLTGVAQVDNLGIQLSNLDGTPISIGDSSSSAPATLVTTAGTNTKEATLRYMASYVRTGTGGVAAGRVVSYVQYSIAYP